MHFFSLVLSFVDNNDLVADWLVGWWVGGLVGLSLVCLVGFISKHKLWEEDEPSGLLRCL